MLSYFQLLYAYFSLIKIISPTLFTAIYGYSELFLVIFSYFTLGYF